PALSVRCLIRTCPIQRAACEPGWSCVLIEAEYGRNASHVGGAEALPVLIANRRFRRALVRKEEELSLSAGRAGLRSHIARAWLHGALWPPIISTDVRRYCTMSELPKLPLSYRDIDGWEYFAVEPPEWLYHYTSLTNAGHIFKSKSLWLTKIQ